MEGEIWGLTSCQDTRSNEDLAPDDLETEIEQSADCHCDECVQIEAADIEGSKLARQGCHVVNMTAENSSLYRQPQSIKLVLGNGMAEGLSPNEDPQASQEKNYAYRSL